MGENFTSEMMEPDLESTEKNIFFSRPTTVFAAVAASIFTVIGVLGKSILASDWLTQITLSSDWLTLIILASDWLTQIILSSDWLT